MAVVLCLVCLRDSGGPQLPGLPWERMFALEELDGCGGMEGVPEIPSCPSPSATSPQILVPHHLYRGPCILMHWEQTDGDQSISTPLRSNPGVRKTMFQLWKLLLLCHLLSGTSAGLLFNFGHGLSNLVDRVKPVLHNGLETIGHRSEGFLNLNSRVPQNFTAKKKMPGTEKVVDLALPYVHPSLENIFGVKISKTVIRDTQAECAADGRSINLRFLVTANVTATLPLVCKRVNLEVFLDLLTRIGLVPVPQTSLFTVVVGEFTADPASIKVSLLDRANDTINKAMNSTNGVLKMVFSALLQKQLCPWIQSSLDGLQVSSLEDIYAGLQHAVALQVSI